MRMCVWLCGCVCVFGLIQTYLFQKVVRCCSNRVKGLLTQTFKFDEVFKDLLIQTFKFENESRTCPHNLQNRKSIQDLLTQTFRCERVFTTCSRIPSNLKE